MAATAAAVAGAESVAPAPACSSSDDGTLERSCRFGAFAARAATAADAESVLPDCSSSDDGWKTGPCLDFLPSS